ncbi:hypothetical protein CCACVL1_25542, partial [Corchorus capsularis]
VECNKAPHSSQLKHLLLQH